MKLKNGTIAQVTFMGRLVNVAKTKIIDEKSKVTKLVLAIDASKINEVGEFEDYSQFHSISIWGKATDFISEYGQKGMLVYVDASIKNKSQAFFNDKAELITVKIPEFHANSITILSWGNAKNSETPCAETQAENSFDAVA